MLLMEAGQQPLLLTKLVGLLLVLLCTNSSTGQGPIGSPGGRSLREPMDRSIGLRVQAPGRNTGMAYNLKTGLQRFWSCVSCMSVSEHDELLLLPSRILSLLVYIATTVLPLLFIIIVSIASCAVLPSIAIVTVGSGPNR